MKVHSFHASLFLALSLYSISSFSENFIQLETPNWKYLNDGSNQGTAWQTEIFDDSTWGTISSSPYYIHNATSAGITSYFRHTFNVADPSLYLSLDLSVYRDDGAVVYINGTEVFRDPVTMPTGSIAYNTSATAEVLTGDELTPVTTTLDNNVLHTGVNTIAVEVHQFNPGSADLSFAVVLKGNEAVTRGPYLQMITPTSAVIRWRTFVANDTKVNYGKQSDNLKKSISDTTVTTEHEINLTGLKPATTYYYNIGTTTNVLASGSDYFFKTQPRSKKGTPTRIWVIGDSGSGLQEQLDVYNGYKSYVGAQYTDLWLMLGDNAYYNGTDSEYQAGFFDIYQTLMHQTVVWPALGNHDGYSVNTPAQTGPYYDIFTLPTLGEAGGVASSTEAYYSYNYGNIHFVVLDSFDVDRSATADMATWLEADLAATTADWIIAYWHHPPYSKGSHNSDAEIELIEMRENILPILEQHSVDLVLSGHSHSYERSKFIDGHYGNSSTYLDSLHAIYTNSGNPEVGDTAYTKVYPSVAHGGTVYTVAGTSGGQGGFGNLDHPAMFYSSLELGSMIIDIDKLALSARFINQNGVVRDSFRIQKYRCSKSTWKYVRTHNEEQQYLQVCSTP